MFRRLCQGRSRAFEVLSQIRSLDTTTQTTRGPARSVMYRSKVICQTCNNRHHNNHHTRTHTTTTNHSQGSALPFPRSCMHACSSALGRRGFEKVQPLRLDRIVFSDEKMFRFGESGLSAQNCRVHTKVPRKRDLKPSMVAVEGDKFMKGIMVAAGATLDGGVWEPHFVPSTVKMASPEYHGLLAHYYPKATAQVGMDFVTQEDGAPSHSSAMTRNWRSDAANWPPTATLFTPGFHANSAVWVRVLPAYTGRLECTHGGVSSLHTGVFTVPNHTAHTTPQPHHTTQTHTETHTTTHTTSHGEREKERKVEREREEKEDREREKRQRTKEKMRQDKTR